MIRRPVVLAAVMAGALFLTACDSAEDRAQKHFEQATELLQQGDIPRALVELRNVFQLDSYHKQARLAYARIEEDRGNLPGAYQQYLKIVEKDADDLDGQRALARIAATLGQWDEAERHAKDAAALSPDDPVVRSVMSAVAYRGALRDEDADARAEAVSSAKALLADDAGLTAARRVVIDDLLRNQDWEDALTALEAGIEQSPDDLELYRQKLGVLEKLDRPDAIEAQLKAMAERFPDNAGIHATLVRWYVSRGKLDQAEAYLRSRIDPEDPAPEARMTLVQFLNQTRGPEAARAEIDRILKETDANGDLYRSVRAGLDFDAGNPDAAIAQMQDILDGAEPSDQTNRIKVTLAQMLIRTGNPVGARALVEEVLADDPSQVEALKLKAGWLIEDDRTADALVDLRQALDQAPRDADIMTLMARAHERAGNRDLMGEMLSLAVEASNSAPEESVRYAAFLMQDNKLRPAEDTLIAALRLQPDNASLLTALGNVYVRMEDWLRAQDVIDKLERLDTAETKAAANELTARKLAGQNREDELESFLSGLADSGSSGLQAAASVIRLRISEGDVAGALDYVQKQLAEHPDDPALRFIQGTVLAIDGQTDQAETIFRDLIEAHPQEERLRIALYNLYRSRGEEEKASTALDAARTALPDSGNLDWMKAGELERSGDIEGAIAIYEDLYKRNSNSTVIANNLASLISSYREDPEALQRAYEIARRLRGTDRPPFQDTYGWIAQRLGNTDEALEYLEPAAEALPDNPTVQYHLAKTYAAAGRDAEALEQFRAVAALVEKGAPKPPFMDDVTDEIARLEDAAPAPDAQN